MWTAATVPGGHKNRCRFAPDSQLFSLRHLDALIQCPHSHHERCGTAGEPGALREPWDLNAGPSLVKVTNAFLKAKCVVLVFVIVGYNAKLAVAEFFVESDGSVIAVPDLQSLHQ